MLNFDSKMLTSEITIDSFAVKCATETYFKTVRILKHSTYFNVMDHLLPTFFNYECFTLFLLLL